MISDYFLVRRRNLDVTDLYRRGGALRISQRLQSQGADRVGGRCRRGADRPRRPAVALALRLRLVCGLFRFRWVIFSADARARSRREVACGLQNVCCKKLFSPLPFLHHGELHPNVGLLSFEEVVLTELQQDTRRAGALGELLPPLTPQRSRRRIRALPDVLRRALHSCLPHAHRYSQVHQENQHGQSARLGSHHSRIEFAGRHLRARLPGAGIVRRRVRSWARSTSPSRLAVCSATRWILFMAKELCRFSPRKRPAKKSP